MLHEIKIMLADAVIVDAVLALIIVIGVEIRNIKKEKS